MKTVLKPDTLSSLVKILIVFSLLLPFSCSLIRTTSPDNFLLITLDTTRYDYFIYALNGAPKEVRPKKLERFLQDAAVFRNAITAINSTNPSHLSIFTSQYPSRLGIHSNVEKYDQKYPTLAEILTQKGFQTAAAVSAFHLGNPKFDILRGFTDRAIPRGAFLATRISDLGIEWLNKKPRKRFFLWLHYFDPHAVYVPPDPFLISNDLIIPEKDRGLHESKSSVRVLDRDPFFIRSGFGSLWENWIGNEKSLSKIKQLYMGELLFMCHEIGRVLEFLEKSEYHDNTLIVIVADHGESLGEHDIYFDHMGLYEPQVRVPLIFHYPARIKKGMSLDAQVRTIDIMPTVLEMLKIETKTKFEGSSLGPFFWPKTESEIHDRTALIENVKQTKISIRSKNWNFIFPIKTDPVLQNSIELYDLIKDPAELVNLSSTRKDIAASMKKMVENYLKQNKKGNRPKLTEEEKEMLKSLGYVD